MNTKQFILFMFVSISVLFASSYAYTQSKPTDSANTAALTAKMRGTFIKDTLVAGSLRPMYSGAKGGRYVIRISSVTNKPYKQYFKKQ